MDEPAGDERAMQRWNQIGVVSLIGLVVGIVGGGVLGLLYRVVDLCAVHFVAACSLILLAFCSAIAFVSSFVVRELLIWRAGSWRLSLRTLMVAVTTLAIVLGVGVWLTS